MSRPTGNWFQKTWYWAWYKFDWGHSIVGFVSVWPVAILPCVWTVLLSCAITGIFFWFESKEAAEEGDKAWPAMKGYMAGFILMSVATAIIYKTIEEV